MTQLVLTKAPGGALVPVDAQAEEYIAGMKVGAAVTATVKRHRNPQFHRKFFALLNFAFDAWEPEGKEYKGEPVRKEFEQFRNDVVILAGYYTTSINLRGEVRLTAKSISFAAMDEDEFSKLYSAVVDVILTRILTKYTKEDLDQVVERLLRFT